MKIAIPDIVSNSYFPAIAAVDLGFCREEGVELEIAPIFPLDRAYAALREGEVGFVATTAHGALSAFPDWRGCKLICAQSQFMYWFLVLRTGLELSQLAGARIGAAPWADDGLRGLLRMEGIDPGAVRIGQPDLRLRPGQSFGVAMAEALGDGVIDGFWANGMAAEIAVRAGTGRVVVDVRRGDRAARWFTQPSIVTTDRLIGERPEMAAGMVRAVVRAQAALRAEPGIATRIAAGRFPAAEAALIEGLVVRDLPYYSAEISRGFVDGMVGFARSLGQISGAPGYDDIVAAQFAPLWSF